MRTKKKGRLFGVVLLVVGGMVSFGPADLLAAPPQGVFKQAIHMGLSADGLDPATTAGSGGASYFPMYLFHDPLFKPMPDGLYAPCLAESWKISRDSKEILIEFSRAYGM